MSLSKDVYVPAQRLLDKQYIRIKKCNYTIYSEFFTLPLRAHELACKLLPHSLLYQFYKNC